MQQAVNTV